MARTAGPQLRQNRWARTHSSALQKERSGEASISWGSLNARQGCAAMASSGGEASQVRRYAFAILIRKETSVRQREPGAKGRQRVKARRWPLDAPSDGFRF